MGQKYDIGKIRAENIAIGSHARVDYEKYADPKYAATREDALSQVRQLIELLAIHAEEIDSPHAVQADAESIEADLRKKKPNCPRIENLIGKITPAVTGVTALANAIDAVRTTVSHL